MSEFLVSIVMPAFNAGKYIRKAVEAAVNQDEVGEVVIVEDSSPDNTYEVCKQLAMEYNKVKLLRHPDNKNHGCGASRNLALTNAKYDYIAFADADNYYLPNRFKLDKEIFEKDSSIEGVYHAEGNHYYSEKAKQTFFDAGFSDQEYLKLSDVVPPEELIYVLIKAHPEVTGEFGTDAITVKKSSIDKVGPFNTKLRLQQDVDLWIRLAAKCKIVAGDIKNPVALRGVHENQRMVNAHAQRKYGLMRWKSMYAWFKKEISDKKLFKIFEWKYNVMLLENSNKLMAFIYFTKYILLNPKHIKYQYGFFDTAVFDIFGRNTITKKIISAKNKILKTKYVEDYRTVFVQ